MLLFLCLSLVLADRRYVIHMSDQHYDQRYKEGAPANCLQEPVGVRCCREGSIPVDPQEPAEKYGEYTCDTPYALVEDSLIWMQSWLKSDPIGQKVDFLVWTGDDPGHDDGSQSPEFNLKAVMALTNLYKQYLPDVRILPSFGNHDAYPCDELDPNLSNWLFVPCAGNWSVWIPEDDAQQTLTKAGFYSTLVAPGQRIISLETTWYDDRNHFIYDKTDVNGQDTWLNQTLLQARANGEKVWIIGHIYPGSTREVDTLNYQDVSYAFKDVIRGHLYGHSHHDHFRMLHPNHPSGTPANDNVTGVVYIAPALMPDAQDPGWRVYEYDTDTFEITDVLTYHASLPVLNQELQVTFNLTYRATEAYQMPDASPASWWDLLNRMETNDSLFQAFMGFQNQGLYNNDCSGSCKTNQICDLRYVVDADVSTCNEQPTRRALVH